MAKPTAKFWPGDLIFHDYYGNGIVKDVYLNRNNDVCYDVFFNNLNKIVTVIDDSLIHLTNRHSAKEDARDFVKSMSLDTDGDEEVTEDDFKEFVNRIINAIGRDSDDEDENRVKAPRCNNNCKEAKDEHVKKSSQEAVNHPSHYNTGKIEVIDYIESLGLGTGFNLGNAIKYLSRAGHKIRNSEKQDIEKALWYIERQRKSWEKEWHLFNAPTKNKINTLHFIDDKRLSYCLGSAIDSIDASLSTGSKSIAIANLKQAENALSFWLETYCDNEKG